MIIICKPPGFKVISPARNLERRQLVHLDHSLGIDFGFMDFYGLSLGLEISLMVTGDWLRFLNFP